MIQKIKKPVSILLVFMMIVSLFAIVPITASAETNVTFVKVTDASQIDIDNIAECSFADAKAWILDNWDDVTDVEEYTYLDFYYYVGDDLYVISFCPDYISKTDFEQNVTAASDTDFREIEDEYGQGSSIYLCALSESSDDPASASYVKVTSEPQDWSGDYLIVYEDGSKAFNGSADELNSSGNYIDVTISGGEIASDAATDAAKVTIAQIDGGYSIATATGAYIGGQSGANKIISLDEAILNTISLDDDDCAVIVSNNTYLRYNTGWGGFRYYKSVQQQPVTLYKLTGGSAPAGETITLDLNADNADIYWDDSTAEDEYWRIDADYDDGNKSLTLTAYDVAQAAGTFTIGEEMSTSSCCIIDPEASEDIYFTAGSCTVTVENGTLTVAGTFTDDDGNTYNVTITYVIPEPAPAVASVTVGTTTTDYTDFSEALTAWSNASAQYTYQGKVGATLKLLSDVETSSSVSVIYGSYSYPMILDLNGYGIRYTGSSGAVIDISGSGNDSGNLRLADSDTSSRVHYITLDENGRGVSVADSGTESATCIKVIGGYLTGGTGRSGSNGGGVYIGGPFFMEGGTIVGNTTSNGGGVYLVGTNTFSLTGGTITGNKASVNGGGVYVLGGGATFNLSGGAVVIDNLKGTEKNNVQLRDGKKININGELSDSASIGVTMATPGVFTSSSTIKAKDYADKFTSDDDTYSVEVDGDELKLAELATVTHTVTWKNEDGTILKTEVLAEGATPTYTGENPEKAEDENYTYTFAGWTDGTNTYAANELPAVTADVTYTATFTFSPSLVGRYVETPGRGASNTMVFPDCDVYITGVTGTQTIHNTSVTYSHSTAGSYDYLYFNGQEVYKGGWAVRDGIRIVSGSGTPADPYVTEWYTTPTITWKLDEDTVIDTTKVPFDAVPTHAAPTKEPDEEYTYTFAGWSPEPVAVTDDATYTATFTAVPRPYNVNVETAEHGTVTANPAEAAKGNQVTLTAEPDAGYALSSIKAFKKNTNSQQATLTALAGSSTGGEGYDKLVDGNTNTKWGFNGGSGYIIVKADKAFILNDYSLTTANDTNNYSGRNWKNWEIYGANFASDSEAVENSDQWQLVTSVSNDSKLQATNFTRYDYSVNTDPEAYQYYKIEISANKGDGYTQMSELTLSSANYDVEVVLMQDSADPAKYTFEMPASNVTVKAEFEEAPAPVEVFTGHNITLGGDIGVNFFLDKTAYDNLSGTKTVKFVLDKTEYTGTVSAYDNEKYVVTCDVVAAQMAHTITATLYVDDKAVDTDDYSVQQYAETVFENPEAYDDKGKPEQLKALAKALLNYGAMAQTVFYDSLKEHPALANTVVGNNGYEGVTADQIEGAIKGSAFTVSDVETALEAKFYTSSLIYLSRNTLRLYFTPTTYPGTIPNADKYAGNLSGYYYYVDAANIPAAELDNQQTFNVNGKKFTFSALDYAKAVVNSGMGDDQKNLAKALYLYNQAANAYFDAAPAPVENVVDLGTLEGDYEAQDGDVLTGKLVNQYKITIADGATVTLKDLDITCLTNDNNVPFAGITPLGDATIMLEGANTVKGGYEDYPGVFVPVGKTLTINGTGSLNASSNGYGCGIGGGYQMAAGNIVINGGNITAIGGSGEASIGGGNFGDCGSITINGGTVTANCSVNATGGAGIGSGGSANCGDITINGGNVTANGEENGAGIGSGGSANCGNILITGGTITANGGGDAAGIGSGLDSTYGNITINGGTITANGGEDAAGIGGGWNSKNCGDITIAATVTSVTATKGSNAPNSIGAGLYGTCGTITIAPSANVTQN